MSRILAYTDGACRVSNPGITSCAWVIYFPNGAYEHSEFLGPELHTNNFAEYMGVLTLLRYLYVNKVFDVDIFCDSKLVVEQINQHWAISSVELKPLCHECLGLLKIGHHTLSHINGHYGIEGNERADKLCNEILDIHMEKNELLKSV